MEQQAVEEGQADHREAGKGFHYAAGTIHFVASVVALAVLVLQQKDALLSESLLADPQEDREEQEQGIDDVSHAVAALIPDDSDHVVDRMTSRLLGIFLQGSWTSIIPFEIDVDNVFERWRYFRYSVIVNLVDRHKLLITGC